MRDSGLHWKWLIRAKIAAFSLLVRNQTGTVDCTSVAILLCKKSQWNARAHKIMCSKQCDLMTDSVVLLASARARNSRINLV